jgi:hypothetical protein
MASGAAGPVHGVSSSRGAQPRGPRRSSTAAPTKPTENASDGNLRARISGFEAFSCSDLCNQVPEDPPACQPLDTMPSKTSIECAP